MLYVIIKDYGYEGKTPPLVIFDDKGKADLFVAGFNATNSGTLIVKEMELNVIYGEFTNDH